MAPKKTVTPVALKPVPPTSGPGGKPPLNKGEVSNFLGQLSHSTDPNKKQTLQLYKGLGRFDSQKADILQKWKNDKSCRWVTEFYHEKTSMVVTTTESLQGYGSRRQH